MSARRRPRGTHAVFALVTVVLAVLGLAASLALADLYLHRRYAATAGLNVWGYRGPVAPPKARGARRVVVLGGSTTFGYGVTAEQSMPAFLERALRTSPSWQSAASVDVLNLGYNNEGAYAFRLTLEDYRYLDYDLAVFYTGYNDLSAGNTTAFRRRSPIFRLTGYMPILPLVLAEKAAQLRYGTVDDGYRAGRTKFEPDLVRKTGAGALEAAAMVTRALEQQLGRLSDGSAPSPRMEPVDGCGSDWRAYCGWIAAAADYALSQGQRVLVVGQPYVADRHIEQQAALELLLGRRFADEPHLRVVNLGRLVDLRDRTLSFDGMHLTAAGNEKIAAALVGSVVEMLR